MYIVGIVPRKDGRVQRPQNITPDCVRLMYNQFWADANGDEKKYVRNLVELVKWATMYQQPLYFDFATALWTGDNAGPKWQRVEAEDVKAIYHGMNQFSSPWAQLLARLHEDALEINKYIALSACLDIQDRIRNIQSILEEID